MKRIICIGELALRHRVEIDLNWHWSDRRVMLVRDRWDTERVRGLRGPDFWWINMGADAYQHEVCAVQQFRQVTIDEAREALRAR